MSFTFSAPTTQVPLFSAPVAPAAGPSAGVHPSTGTSTSAQASPTVEPKDQRREQELLQTILKLMIRRSSSEIPPVEVFRDTNTLLKQNLLTKLLTEIRDDVKMVSSSSPGMDEIHWDMMRMKAEIVFFALYQTQATDDEARELLSIIKELSDLIAEVNMKHFCPDDVPTSATAVPSSFNTAGSTIGAPGTTNSVSDEIMRKKKEDASKHLFVVLIILQLSHLGAHQQTVPLYSRESEYTSQSDIDNIPLENKLLNTSGSKYNLDRDDWKCSGAKAFTCLVYGVFRQPEVDDERAPPSDVVWFLHEACVLRGYSYIRLCILPVIQMLGLIDRETILFYLGIVADLLENLSEIYRMSFYREEPYYSGEDFPHVFFPPTHDHYKENIRDYLSHAVLQQQESSAAQNQRTGRSTGFSTLLNSSFIPEEGVDTLEDIILLHTEMMSVYPNYCKLFWCIDSTSGGDFDISGAIGNGGETYTPHHFVTKMISACQSHASLWIPSVQYLTMVANGPGSSTSKAVFFYFQNAMATPFHWSNLIGGIVNIVMNLKDDNTNTGNVTNINNENIFNKNYINGVQPPVLGSNMGIVEKVIKKPIEAIDISTLLAVIDLFASIGKDLDVAKILVSEEFLMIDKMVDVLSCSLPIDIKGAALRCLANLAQHDISYAMTILDKLESFSDGNSAVTTLTNSRALITTTVTTVSGPPTFSKLFLASVRMELEEREAKLGQYPITDGFLQLLLNIFKHGEDIIRSKLDEQAAAEGNSKSRDAGGLIPYIDFVIEDVLLKVHQRRYLPDTRANNLAQRWKLSSRAVQILDVVLQKFSSVALESVTIGLTPSAKSKLKQQYQTSPGFYVLATMLGNSRLTELIMQFLRGLDNQYLITSSGEYFSAEISSVVESLLYFSNRPLLQQKKAAGFAGGLGGATSMSGVGVATFDLFNSGNNVTNFRRDTVDPIFWIERSLAGVIAILYNISRHENRVLLFARVVYDHDMYLTKFEGKKISHFPIVLFTLSGIIAGNYLTKHLIQLMTYPFRTRPITPSVSVLVVKIIEHFATSRHTTGNRGMGGSTVGEGSGGLISATAGGNDALDTLMVDKQVIESFSRAISFLDQGGKSVINDFGEYLAVSSGGEAKPITTFWYSVTDEKEFIDFDEGNTLREAVLVMLLGTLTNSANQITFNHQLLGFDPSIVMAHTGGIRATTSLFSRLPSVSSRMDCLDAILSLLHPYHHSFFQRFPSQACDCYELIYRLACNPLTKRITLQRLREKHVDFFKVHLNFFAKLMSLEVPDIVHLTQGNQMHTTDSPSVVVSDFIFALNQSISWLLKTCILELIECQLNCNNVSMINSSNEILRYLFSYFPAGTSGGVDTSTTATGDQLAITKFLSFAILNIQNIVEILFHKKISPIMIPFIKESLQIAITTKAGRSFGDEKNPFIMEDNRSPTASPKYEWINCNALKEFLLDHPTFSHSTPEEKQSILQIAIEENLKKKLDASSSHVMLSWRSLVDYLMLSDYYKKKLFELVGGVNSSTNVDMNGDFGGKVSQNGKGISNSHCSRYVTALCVTDLLLPLTRYLVVHLKTKNIFIKEQLSRSLISLMQLCESNQVLYDLFCFDIVSDDQIQQIVDLFIVVIRAGSSSTANLEVGELSFTFQGYICSALNMLVRMLMRSNNAITSANVLDEDAASPTSTLLESIVKPTLRKHSLDMLDALVNLSTKGFVAWRLVGFTTLATLLEVCNHGNNNLGARLSGRVIQHLNSKGLVDEITSSLQHHLWNNTNLHHGYGSGGNKGGSPVSLDESMELLNSTLQFFSKMVEFSRDGIDSVVKSGILTILSEMNTFRRYPAAQENATGSSSSSSFAISNSGMNAFRKGLLSVFRFFSLILANSESRSDILQGVATFLRKNHTTCAHIFRIRDHSMKGLQLTEAVTYCFVLVVTQAASLPEPGNQYETNYSRMTALLGDELDALLLDCAAMIDILGELIDVYNLLILMYFCLLHRFDAYPCSSSK